MLIDLCLFQTKIANNSVVHVDTIMIIGGILEGVWPMDNQKKIKLCKFRCQSKSVLIGFFTHILTWYLKIDRQLLCRRYIAIWQNRLSVNVPGHLQRSSISATYHLACHWWSLQEAASRRELVP